MIKLGVCVNQPEQLAILIELGYDYAELPLFQLMDLNESEFNVWLNALNKSGIPCKACNCFVPSRISLTGEPDLIEIDEYLTNSLIRANQLGAELIVFGSGGARAAKGMDTETALAQLVDFLRAASDKAAKYGIHIAIEPLNKGECDIINTVTEAGMLAERVDRENVKITADYYHMCLENEPIGSLESKYLAHAHIADALRGRAYPLHSDAVAPFINGLKAVGYDGLLSIEGNADDFAKDAAGAYTLTRNLLAK